MGKILILEHSSFIEWNAVLGAYRWGGRMPGGACSCQAHSCEALAPTIRRGIIGVK